MTTRYGYGRIYKTRRAAEKEARDWNDSGDGREFNGTSIDADVVEFEGDGYACRYITKSRDEDER